MLDPGRVDGSPDLVAAVGRGLYGADLSALGRRDRRDAGADGLAIQMHRAGAAQGRAAAELGPRQPQRIAQGPEDGGVGVGVDRVRAAVDVEGAHGARFSILGAVLASVPRPARPVFAHSDACLAYSNVSSPDPPVPHVLCVD
eukprot:Opistho-2@44873